MITIKAHGWQQFLAAFGVLRAAGVDLVASGGNEMRVPDDTDRHVLRAVAATGAAVHADLTEREPGTVAAATTDTETPAPQPPPEAVSDDGPETGAASTAVTDSKPQVDTPPQTAEPAPPQTRATRKTPTRRKTKE